MLAHGSNVFKIKAAGNVNGRGVVFRYHAEKLMTKNTLIELFFGWMIIISTIHPSNPTFRLFLF